jgi:hypothetical protein
MPQFHYGGLSTRCRDFPTGQGETASYGRLAGIGRLWDNLSVTNQGCKAWENNRRFELSVDAMQSNETDIKGV